MICKNTTLNLNRSLINLDRDLELTNEIGVLRKAEWEEGTFPYGKYYFGSLNLVGPPKYCFPIKVVQYSDSINTVYGIVDRKGVCTQHKALYITDKHIKQTTVPVKSPTQLSVDHFSKSGIWIT
jgi:hypothetical protein